MKKIINLLLFGFTVVSVNAQPGIAKYDISAGFDNSFPQYFEKFGDQLCFFAASGAKGWEPWVADSIGNFQLIGDINTQANTSSLEPGIYKRPVCAANGKFYFSANNGFSGTELYSWAGGSATPILTADIEPGGGSGNPDNMVLMNNIIYFKARTQADGFEIFQFNTQGGIAAERKTDINPGPDSSVTGNLVAYSNKIFFTAKTAAAGNELFVYDPALDTAVIVSDINPGPASSNPEDFVVFNSRVYFSADDGVHGRELFSYINGGTVQRHTDINAGVSSSIALYGVPHMAGFNGKLYFSAHNGNSEYHMYSFDPATSQTALACSTNNAGGSDPTWLTSYGGKLYFNAYDTVHGFELRSFDGTNPPQLVADICEGKGSGKAQNLTVIGDNLYFRANDCDTVGDELFKYNYVTAGIGKLQFSGDVRLYPNPVKDYANLEMTLNKAETLLLRVTDIAGRTVWQLGAEKYTAGTHYVRVPLGSMLPGTYFYGIYDMNGAYCAGGTIIKQ